MTPATQGAPDAPADRLHASHAQGAALVAGRTLPAREAIVASEPKVLAEATDLVLPGSDSRGAAVTISGGAAGTLALVVSGELAAAIAEGASGAAGLVGALRTSLDDAIAALEPHYPDPLQPSTSRDLDLEHLGFGTGAVTVDLLDDGDHVATLVVDLLPDGVPRSAPASYEPELFSPVPGADLPAEGGPRRSLELLHDVEMAVTVELGRTRMTVRDLLALAPGAVVELDRSAGSPVDVLVNGKLIARGEVVVIDEEFGIRISEIVGLRTVRP
ncbi:MAG: flagellar motor switch protein FliN [Acidimicrobiales bacterium]